MQGARATAAAVERIGACRGVANGEVVQQLGTLIAWNVVPPNRVDLADTKRRRGGRGSVRGRAGG